jgi:hypothetical protein
VSRHHARIVVEGDRAVAYDLGSRNGVKLNGTPLKDPVELKDGDRLRIGTQELVFCRVESAPNGSAKTTGFLRHCASCRMPYPQEVGACPNCGATEALDEETLSGQFGAAAQQIWSVQLFLEVLERALALQRFEDIHRILRRATSQLEERMARGDAIDPGQLAKVAVGASQASLALNDAGWAVWTARVYRRTTFAIPEDVVAKLAELGTRFPRDLEAPVGELVAHLRNVPVSSASEANALSALERVRARLAGALPEADETQ